MRILIVDDSSTMRRIIGNVVMQLGFSKESFDEAEDGLKAWKLLTCLKPMVWLPAKAY